MAYTSVPPSYWEAFASLVLEAAYEATMATHGHDIRRLLAQLPRTPLEDADLSVVRPAVVELFDLLLNIDRVGLAGATKWLYPFRPRFLAVLDKFPM